jgi:hypothetical protein
MESPQSSETKRESGDALPGQHLVEAAERILREEDERQKLAPAEQVLREEERREVGFVQHKLDEFLADPERMRRMYETLHEKKGWSIGETSAMFRVLQHAMLQYLYSWESAAPNEMERAPEGTMSGSGRGIRPMLVRIIEHDFNRGVAEKAVPLIDLFTAASGGAVKEFRGAENQAPEEPGDMVVE